MADLHNLKFFIVDDDPFSRMLYHKHLTNLGFTDSTLFENGRDCINQLSTSPDIIFLDYDMKPDNGLEILRIIKRFNPGIYLLVISSQKDIHIAINALKYGAFDYIEKGENDLEKISSVINKIIFSKGLKNKLSEVNNNKQSDIRINA